VAAVLRYLAWFLRIGIFVVLFVLAARNTEPVVVRFLLGEGWHVPLALALLAAVAVGVALGLLACVPRLVRQRRQLAKLRKALEAAARASGAGPASVVGAPGLPIDSPTLF